MSVVENAIAVEPSLVLERVTGSLNVRVIVAFGDASCSLSSGLIVTVGAAVSTVKEAEYPTVLPAASSADPLTE